MLIGKRPRSHEAEIGINFLYLAERLCTEIYETEFDALDTLESALRTVEQEGGDA